MKTIALVILFSLTTAMAWAKGGNNPWIPGEDLQERLRAFGQVKVTFNMEENQTVFVDSIKDFTDFLSYLESDLVTQFTLSKSVHLAQFCINLTNSSKKSPVLGEINEELSSYPDHLHGVSVNSDLKFPCN